VTTPSLGTVLLVDDDKKLTFILAAHLRTNGYEVLEADNGRDGLELARRHQPDVIVMDVSMPVMDGLEATRLLKNEPSTENIPVIMLTGKSRTQDVVVGLEAGASEYVRKPFDVSELLARIRTMMRLGNTRRALDEANDKLTHQVASKTRQLELLYNYAQALNRITEEKAVHQLVVDTVRQLTGSGRISLMLKNNDGTHLRCVRAVGIDPEIVGRIRVKAMDGIAGQVFTSGKTFVARAYGDNAEEESRKRYVTDTFLSTPLISTSLAAHEETLGVLNVTEREDGQQFGQEEIDCIRSVADSAAIALRNLQQRRQLRDSIKVLLLTVGRLAEYRDEETADHLERVAKYTRLLTAELRNTPRYADCITLDFIDGIHQAAPLHDIGKVGIPDDILTKPGALSREEFRVMQTHTEIGRQTLEFALANTGPVPLLNLCIDIAYCHHEKHDGSGYPRGIRGEEIPLAARIIALVDAYDAITSRRRYSEPRSHETAVDIVRAESGKHFDPDVAEAFLRCADQFDAIRRTQECLVEEPVLAPV